MKASIEQYARAWHETLKEADQQKYSEINQAFLQKLLVEGRLGWLPRIVSRLREFIDQNEGVVPAHVRAARDMDPAELEHTVRELLGHENVRVSSQTDASLIGGMVIETSDKRWNLSMRHQLDELKQQLCA